MKAEELSQEVESIFVDCLGEAGDFYVEGTVVRAFIRLGKIEKNRDRLKTVLGFMPVQFFPTDEGGGGGWSFLQLCTTRDEYLWTGMHQMCDKLIVLCIAAKMAKFVIPREMWKILPGGMPYVVFSLKETFE